MSHLLELKDFHYYYGGIHAVKGINLHIDKGEIVALIGANGAGKATTLNTIAGLTGAGGVRGQILLNGENIAGKSGHKICNKGIMAVVEGRHVFAQLSVYENLYDEISVNESMNPLVATVIGRESGNYFSVFTINYQNLICF